MARKKESNVHEIKFATKEYTAELGKDGRRLKRKKHWDASSKGFFILCMFLMVTLAVYTVLESISRARGRNILDLDYGSVSVQPLEGEKYTPMSDYTAVDVFARINWTFAHQEKWYSEMHGTVDTVIQQNVSTYKKFNNGILISADLTNSSLISNASEFCYLRDQDIVMWRKAAGGSSTYNGFDTPWQEGDPYRKMTISGEDGFKATNGLPAYELSVYVIEEHTVQSATPIVRGEDGLYTVTYTLVPNTWEEEDDGGNLITKGATAYYSNQMIFSGGLPEPPSFHSITYTLVFDEDWQVYRTDITENYDAKYGPIAANCVYTATTVYEYDTERAESSEFEDYFQNYADAPIDNSAPAEKVPTAANCLAEAFGRVLAEPTTLNVDLSFGGNTYNGIVDLDMSKTDISSVDLARIEAKLKVGPLQAWLKEGDAYLNYGGAKLKVGINELIDLLGEYLKDESTEDPDLLAALGDGTFTYTDKTAELHSTLPLGDFSLPVNFYFLLDGETVSLDKVTADISLKGTELHLQLTYGQEKLPDLSDSEKEDYAPLVPYAKRLINLFSAETLRARISYQKDDLKLKGDLLVGLDPISAKGTLLVSYGGQTKQVVVSYLDKMLYLELDGIKLSASLDEATKLLEKYVELPAGEKIELDIGEVLSNVLSDEFASLIQTTKGESDLTVGLKGTELLQAFGVDFSLGDVTLGVSDEGLSARLLGIEALISEGESFEIDTEGYTSVLQYADGLISLFQNDALKVTVDYATGDLKAHADITVDIKNLTAAGKIKLGYRSAEKTFDVLFADSVVYVCADGIKVSANVTALAELLSDKISIPETDLDARAIVEKVLSLDLGRIASIYGQSDTLVVALNGTLLLQELGFDFDLGEITLEVTGETVKAHALGAEIQIAKGEPFDLDTDGYIEIVGYAKNLIDLFETGYLNAEISYKGKLSVEGTLQLDINELKVQADLTLKYKEITKQIKVMYVGETVYLSVEGLNVKANVKDAVELVKEFVEIPASDTDSTELLEKLLGANFGDLLALKENNGTLEVTLHGNKLLEILGLDFDLGEVELQVSDKGLNAKALGAEINVTKGGPFDLDTDGYIEIVGYAKNLIDLFETGYLNATVKYDGTLKVDGTIALDINDLKVKADLTLTYNTIQKKLHLMYVGETVYLSVEGLNVKANVKDAVELVKEFVEIPENDTDSTELLEKLLGTDFKELLALKENNGTLEVTIHGNKLLEILGLDFDLGEVNLEVSESGLNAKALGAEINVTKGSEFELDTNNYIEIVGYAKNLIDLFETGYLNATVKYDGDLKVEGTLQLDINEPKVQADLTLTYKNITKQIKVMYVDETVYLSVEGLNVKANVKDAVELVKEFVEIPENDTDSTELLEKLLGANFNDLLELSENENTLEVTLHGNKLLEILGLKFDLGEVELQVSESGLNAKALGAEINVTKGSEFELDTNNYIEIVGYAKNLIDLFETGYLNAIVKYDGTLKVDGTLKLDINELKVQADLTLTYKEITKQLKVMYVGETVYLSVEGLNVKANVKDAVELVKEFVEIPASDTDSTELLEKLLGANFGDLLALKENNGTLEVTLHGNKLLEILGLDFELGEVELQVSDSGLNAKALEAEINVTKGEEFTLETDGYIEIVGYAKNLIDLFETGYLNAEIKYTGKLSVEGTLQLDINDLKVQAELTLTYKEITKQLKVMYVGETVYLSVEGLNVKANVKDAVELVKEFVEIPESDTDSNELLEKLLGTDFKELLALKENNGTLEVTLHGNKLLEVLGLKFDLGEVELQVSENKLFAKALDAEINVTKGSEFELDTNNYIEIVGYAKSLIDLFETGYLKAEISYKGKLSVSGNIQLDINDLKVQADLTLTYKNITKQIKVMYVDETVYLSVEGLNVKANVKDAVELVKEFVEIPANDTDSTELLEKLLGANFGDLLALKENENTLEVTIHGNKLLEILGLDFDLGEVNLEVSESGLNAKALGAEINVTKGEPFELNTDGYIEIVGYAKNLIDLFETGYLNATVKYDGELSVSGNIQLDINDLKVQADLELTYKDITKKLHVMYVGETVYLSVEGLNVKANVKDAVELVKEFIEIPETDTDSTELLEKLLGTDFKELLALKENNGTLEVTLHGNKLLEILGLDFELGEVELQVSDSGLNAKALGAEINVTKGKEFTLDTNNYIEIVGYAKNLIDLFETGYLKAEISYKGELSVIGEIKLDINEPKVQAELTLTYKEITKQIKVMYVGETVYLSVEGLNVKANVKDAVELVKEFIEIPASDTDSTELLEKLLGANFGDLLALKENNGTLEVTLHGNKLLEILGLDFDLGEVELQVSENKLFAKALDAEINVTKGSEFELDTNNYIEIVGYAKSLIDLFETGYLKAEISYKGKLSVSGNIQLDINEPKVQADLTLTYKNITKQIKVMYVDETVYLSVEGLNVKANVKDAVELVKEFVEIPENDTDSTELLEKLLGANFNDLLELSENENTLEVTLHGNKLLEILGLKFDLGEVELQVSESGLNAKALGAEINVTKGEPFDLNTDGYIEIVGYAKNLIELFKDGYLNATIDYRGQFTLGGEIALSLKPLAAKGALTLGYRGASKEIKFFMTENTVYLDLDGLKCSVEIKALAALFAGEEKTAKPDPEEMILKLLSMDLSELLTLSEKDNALELLLDGGTLLDTFGIDFDLGDVSLRVTERGLEVNALDANVALAKGAEFAITEGEKAGYIELTPYLANLKEFIESNEFEVEVNYYGETIAVSGELQLSVEKLKELLADKQELNVNTLLNGISARGELEISSGNAKKKVALLLTDGKVYLNLDEIKVSLQIEELLKIFAKEEKAETKSESFDLAQILGMNFGEYLALSEKEGTLGILVHGTELLQYFGKQFALGEVTLGISQEGISLSALGVNVGLKKGTPFAISEEEKTGYTELSPYIKSLKELLEEDNFHAEINYATEDFSVAAKLDFSLAAIKEQREGASDADLLDALRARAEITLSYKTFEKKINVSYVGRAVYLEIDHLRIKTDLPSAQEAVAASLGTDGADEETTSLLEKLLSLPYGELLELSVAEEGEDSGMLSIIVHGTELLMKFGYEFDLKDISLLLGEGEIKLEALGVKISLCGGEDFKIETDGYRDLTELAKKLVTIVGEEKISLTGELKLRYEEEEVSLIIDRSFLGWEGSTLKLDLEGKLVALGAEENFTLRVTKEESGYIVKLSLENLGVKIDVSEMSLLSDAFAGLKTRVEETAKKIVGESNLTHLSAIPGMENLAALTSSASGGKTLLDVLSGILGDFAIEDLLNGLTFGDAEDENALLALVYKDLKITLGEELASDGMLVAKLSYHKEGSKISVEGTLHADAEEGEFPAESETGLCFIEVKHFAALLNQIEAAVGILDETKLDYDVEGKVVTDGETRYSVEGKISYALNGDEVPFKLVGKQIEVAKGLSLVIRLDVVASGKTETGEKKDTSVYLDFWLLDYNTDGNKDGILDFYVSASTVGRPEGGKNPDGYDPIKLYAPSTEIMSVLSSALSVFGMDDIDLLNKYFISQWLTSEKAVKQFHALGESLLSTLTQSLGEKIAPVKEVLKKLGAFAEKHETSAMSLMPVVERTGYIKELQAENNSFKLVLDTDLLYGGSDLKDLTVELARTQGQSGHYVPSTFALSNIYNGAGTEYTCLSFKTATQGLTELQPSEPKSYTSFDGVDSLLVALVNSATHETEGSYAVNDNFYINGSATVSLLSYELNLHDIGISVYIDENNEVGIDAHFVVDRMSALLGSVVVVNGTSEVDLSIRGGMVYIKRVQTNGFKKGFLGLGNTEEDYSPENYKTIYRVMTLDTFFADILGQCKFMFNLSDTVWNLIESQIKENPPAEVVETDVGTKLKKYIRDFTHTNGTDESWTLSLNGEGLSGSDQIGDIDVTLGEKNDLIRTLGAKLGIVPLFGGFLVNVDANLEWRNPAGEMDNNVTDNTTNLRPFLENGMRKLLDETDWSNNNYAEAQGTKVSYKYGEKLLGEENVVYESSTGKLLGELTPPDVTKIRPGYTGYWSAVDKVSENQTFSPAFTANEYKIVFQSNRPASDYTFNEESGYWENTLTWTYRDDARPDLPLREDPEKRMTGFKCPEGHVHTKEENGWHVYDREKICLTAVWEDIVYTAQFKVDGVTVLSTSGLYGSEIAHPANPSKAGYTFEGWENDHAIFEGNYTFIAKFEPKVYTFRLVSDYEIDGFTFDGESKKWTEELSWTYGTNLPALPTERNERRQLVGFRCEKGDSHTGSCELHDENNSVEVYTAEWENIVYTANFLKDGEPYATDEGFYEEEIVYPAKPEKEGYTFTGWSEEPEVYTDNYTLTAKFVPNLYTVIFESETEVPEWTAADGKFTHTEKMYFGSEIKIEADEKNWSYTVTRDNMVVTLPAANDIKSGSLPGKWCALDYQIDETAHTSSAKIVAEYKSRIVIYHSALNCTINGCNQDAEILFESDYTLVNPNSVSGYEFLGWYTQEDDGTWKKIEKIDYKTCDIITEVDALWYQKAGVTLSASRSGFVKYTYKMDASVTNGKLIGALAEKASVSYSFHFTLKKAFNRTSDLGTATSTENSKHYESDLWDIGGTVTVDATITYTYNGTTLKTETVSTSASC